MGKHEIDWQGAWTFEDYVIYLFERKLTDSVEFKALIRVFGRDKLAEIWKKFKELKVSALK